MTPSATKSGFVKVALAAAIFGGLLGVAVFADWFIAKPIDTASTYVGRDSCAQCHQTQVEQFTGSDHDLAMDHATEQSVLADFDNAKLEHHGITSTMFKRDAKYFVNTEGPDGKMADFEVKYVFGFEPLQQYMIEFDRRPDQPKHEVAKLQVLRVSWDTEKKEWFYLNPPDVNEKLAPDDPLHWTGAGQNWNHMCASCHSTDLKKNYDVATKTYHTTYAEIDVSCETCHGPGSTHVELAEATSLFWDRNLGYGLKKLKSDDSTIEIESCAPCHSRRRTVYPDDPPGQNYYDCFANELLTPTTYYCDGQILDEVYVYGSFIQSKMFHKGVRCSDCHDPHTTKLKLPGNKMCVSCHDAHPAGKYDTPNHHHHQMNSEGAKCVSCHMPETPFMEVDFRRDHSIRVPRPDLSVDLQTPNACTGCHLEDKNVDESKHADLPHYAAWMNAARAGDEEVKAEIARVDQWAADLYEQWYPGKYGKKDHFAYALSSGWNGDAESSQPLHELARLRKHQSIVRASALLQLAQIDLERGVELASRLTKDKDPQVRTAAVMVIDPTIQNLTAAIAEANNQLRALQPQMQAPGAAKYAQQILEQRRGLEEQLKARTNDVLPLLEDPIRSVRAESARVLADVRPNALNDETRKLRDAGLREYRAGITMHGDLAMSHMGLALLAERQRDYNGAVNAYRNAISVQPGVTGPRSNLAALYEGLARGVDPKSQQGLNTQAEVKRLRAEELQLLARDAKLAANSAPIQYRYGLALYLAGTTATSAAEANERFGEAKAALTRATELEPETEQFSTALKLLEEKLNEQ